MEQPNYEKLNKLEHTESLDSRDEIIINRALETSRDNHHPNEIEVIRHIYKNQEFFSEKLYGKPIYDIGSPGVNRSEYLGDPKGVGHNPFLDNDYSSGSIKNVRINKIAAAAARPATRLSRGASMVVEVDPFPDLENNMYLPAQMDVGEIIEIDKDVFFVKDDALSFLKKQEDQSGNVVISHVDEFIIKDEEYIKRTVEEIYRVVPVGGIFICDNSPDFEREVRKLFTDYEIIRTMIVFKK